MVRLNFLRRRQSIYRPLKGKRTNEAGRWEKPERGLPSCGCPVVELVEVHSLGRVDSCEALTDAEVRNQGKILERVQSTQ